MTNEIVVQQGGFIAPVADIQTALRRYQAVKDFIGSVLKEGTDYGKIPGSDKLTLLKPGAEKMTAFFGFSVRFILSDFIEDWTGKNHDGEPFFYYRYRAQLWRSDQLVAEGDGSCNSWEKKYRYRQVERICPKCGKPAIIPGKEEYGGGWICFAKKGGCGAKFPKTAPKIVSQQLGQVKNTDPADIVNTIQKMSQKRALIAPVLIATNTSDYFTQDIEDFIDGVVTDIPPMPEPIPDQEPHSKKALHSEQVQPQDYQDQLRSIEANKPVITPQNGEMTLEEAMNIEDSDGIPYSKLTTEKLAYKFNSMDKKMRKGEYNSEEQDKHIRESKAIKLILDSRAIPTA